MQLFIVAILIGNMGLTLAADFFEKESHIAISLAEVNDFKQHQSEDKHTGVSCDSENPEKSHCSDPCHLGQPHLGHASFLCSSTHLTYALFDSGVSAFSFKQNIIDGPFLEGPRRPPKYA